MNSNARVARSRALPVDRSSVRENESVWRISKIFLLGFVLGEAFLLLLIGSLTSLR